MATSDTSLCDDIRLSSYDREILHGIGNSGYTAKYTILKKYKNKYHTYIQKNFPNLRLLYVIKNKNINVYDCIIYDINDVKTYDEPIFSLSNIKVDTNTGLVIFDDNHESVTINNMMLYDDIFKQWYDRHCNIPGHVKKYKFILEYNDNHNNR